MGFDKLIASNEKCSNAFAADKDMTAYLMDLLRKHGADTSHLLTTTNGDYTHVVLTLDQHLTDEEAHNLFTPRTANFDFLVCRQIVRDMGEVTNLRASGIRAVNEETTSKILITLPKKIYNKWISSKSSS